MFELWNAIDTVSTRRHSIHSHSHYVYFEYSLPFVPWYSVYSNTPTVIVHFLGFELVSLSPLHSPLLSLAVHSHMNIVSLYSTRVLIHFHWSLPLSRWSRLGHQSCNYTTPIPINIIHQKMGLFIHYLFVLQRRNISVQKQKSGAWRGKWDCDDGKICDRSSLPSWEEWKQLLHPERDRRRSTTAPNWKKQLIKFQSFSIWPHWIEFSRWNCFIIIIVAQTVHTSRIPEVDDLWFEFEFQS